MTEEQQIGSINFTICTSCGYHGPGFHECPKTKAVPLPFIDYGWACPKCQAVYAPFVENCWNCTTTGKTSSNYKTK